MRTFISINISPDIQEKLAVLQEELRPQLRGVRFMPPGNCHLTLKFLGDIEAEQLPVLEQSLASISSRLSAFGITFGHLGAFPPKGPLSVLWVGLEKGEAPVRALEQEVHAQLVDAGIHFDKKRFVPHLTIGRSRRNQPVYFRPQKITMTSTLGAMDVGAFYIMESQLSSSGPTYTVKAEIPLLG